MTSRSILTVASAIALCLCVTVGAQRPTGTVSGIVVSNESSPRPVRRATVNLVAPDLAVPLSTVTGDDGRFSFGGVPAGHYGVFASKAAYLGAFHGSKRPGRGPGVPVAVAAGATVTNLSLTLTRGSVISGALRLPSGDLAYNMPVTAIAVETVSGVVRLRYAGGRTATNDRGEYRIFGLPAGEYIVIAQPSGLIMGSPTGVNDTLQTTPAEVSWVEAITRAQPGAAAADIKAPPRGRPVNYGPVFYPGTADSALAVPVRIGPGEERSGVDFALALVPTARVSGTVIDRNGAPVPGAAVTLRAPDDRLNFAGIVTERAAVPTSADGSFAIPAVGPGRYQLDVRTSSASDAGIWAQHALMVDGRDIENVSLQLQPGLGVSGRVHFDGTMTAAAVTGDVTGARVTLAPASADGAPDAIASGRSVVSAPVAADGTFAVTALVPASYRIGISMPGLRTTPAATGGAWSLASISLAGADIADRPFDLRPGQPVTGIVAIFTNRPTALSGTLSDQNGRPAPGYPIVVYSTDRSHWRRGSRRISVARPATDGSFRLVGLPPGDYYMAAVVSLDPSETDDPAFLDQLVAASLKVTLTAGTPVMQALRLIK